MKEFYQKHETAIVIIFWSVIALLILLWHLVNVPIQRDFKYEMQGYAIDADGNILAQFPITVEGTEYNFIIDRKNPGSLGWSGKEITNMDQDATFIDFTCEKSSLTESFSAFFPLIWYPTYNPYGWGYLHHRNPKTGSTERAGTLILDMENGTLLWEDTHLIENAFIIGVTDPNADPWDVLQSYHEILHIPELETTAGN